MTHHASELSVPTSSRNGAKSPDLPTTWEERVDFAALHRLVVLEGLHEGSWNHFSYQLPDNPEYTLVTPGQTHWSQVRAGNVLVLDSAGNIVQGDGRPNPSAWAIHGPVHRARPDACCVVHTHMPYATAIALRADGRFNERADQNAAGFYKKVAYFDEYDGVVTESEDGERMAEALGRRSVLFMQNHGVLLVDRTIGLAFTRLYSLERACMVQVLAESGGHKIRAMPKAVAKAVAACEGEDLVAHFEAMKRVLDVREPDYKT